jgi:hypothetical protein
MSPFLWLQFEVVCLLLYPYRFSRGGIYSTPSGTDVMIKKIFSAKKFGEKDGVFFEELLFFEKLGS